MVHELAVKALRRELGLARPVAPVATARSRGRVRFFHARRGYGFIARDNGADVFVHHTNIGAGRRLESGQQVEFDVARGRKGDEAHNVLAV